MLSRYDQLLSVYCFVCCLSVSSIVRKNNGEFHLLLPVFNVNNLKESQFEKLQIANTATSMENDKWKVKCVKFFDKDGLKCAFPEYHPIDNNGTFWFDNKQIKYVGYYILEVQ